MGALERDLMEMTEFSFFLIQTGLDRGHLLVVELEHLLVKLQVCLALTDCALELEFARNQVAFRIRDSSLVELFRPDIGHRGCAIFPAEESFKFSNCLDLRSLTKIFESLSFGGLASIQNFCFLRSQLLKLLSSAFS